MAILTQQSSDRSSVSPPAPSPPETRPAAHAPAPPPHPGLYRCSKSCRPSRKIPPTAPAAPSPAAPSTTSARSRSSAPPSASPHLEYSVQSQTSASSSLREFSRSIAHRLHVRHAAKRRPKPAAPPPPKAPVPPAFPPPNTPAAETTCPSASALETQ